LQISPTFLKQAAAAAVVLTVANSAEAVDASSGISPTKKGQGAWALGISHSPDNCKLFEFYLV